MKERMRCLAKMSLYFVLVLQFLTGCTSKNSISGEAQIHTVTFLRQTADAPIQTILLPGKQEQSFDEQTMVQLNTGGGVLKLSLQEYLAGVLYAELPADFSLEAKKALAVAARTVTLKKQSRNEVICDDPACCQAWLPQIEYQTDVLKAVHETDGEVLYYIDELIEATYFSCSGGMTEAAVEVWGNEVSYLQAVESPGEETAPRYAQTITVLISTFEEVVEAELDLSAQPFVTDLVQTIGGGVRSLKIGGVEFTGLELRRYFDLPSTRFVVTASAQYIRFRCLGFGHRVGLSQYGADAMAKEGKTFEEILRHYYPGTEIRNAP